MAIFTSAAVAAFLAVEAGAFTVAAAFVLNAAVGIAASLGLSYAAKALAGDPNQDQQTQIQGVQGTLQAGADVPRSFNLGYSVTAGSLVYANVYGELAAVESHAAENTPNAYLTQVIALSDLPGGTLEEVWINGERVTLGPMTGWPGDVGFPVIEYNKESSDGRPAIDHLWIKYYDGTQTTADPWLTDIVSTPDHPYESTRVGVGIAYVIVTSLVNDTLFTGFPTCKFAVSGIPLYDPTKDSTNGGSGSHRYSDKSTWGGDGDDLPAVQAYNVLRGIYYNDIWLYGLQRMAAARLPSINWNAQIDKCRAVVDGEPTYRTGGQVSVNVQTVQTIEALLTGCQGRLSEIGGFYKVHLGAPDSPSFAWTDDDILSTEEQNFAPFFGLADSVNGIQATYPDPQQGWNMATAPVYKVPAMVARDGARNLLASPSFDFVPYPTQVQRLQKSAIEEASRERRHSLTLPPQFWIVEPGDVGEWTSERNGYVDKQFRVDGITDKANLDVLFNITEVDPADYDWDHDADFQPVTTGPTIIARPAPQGVLDWNVEGVALLDDDGYTRRPAILLTWDAAQPGCVGIRWQVRLKSSGAAVTSGLNDLPGVSAINITNGILPLSTYQVAVAYIPSAPRDMLWSDYRDVTTPDARASLADFDAALQQRVTTEFDAVQAQFDELNQRMSTLVSKLGAGTWTDIKSVRSQLAARSDAATASIDEVRTVAVSATEAVATLGTTVSATFGPDFSSVNTVSSAVATLDGYAAGSWGVVIDVNGKITAAVHLDGSAATSVFDVLASTFRVSLPGSTGGTSVPVFTISNVSGSPKLTFRGDMQGDGDITARNIATGAITAIKIAAGTITATEIAAGAINTTQLAINSVDILNVIAGAMSQEVIAPNAQALSVAQNQVVATATMTVKTGQVYIEWMGGVSVSTASTSDQAWVFFYVDGIQITPGWGWTASSTAGYSSYQFLKWYVTGLSNGSHTFDLRRGPAGTPGLATLHCNQGFLRVQELRR